MSEIAAPVVAPAGWEIDRDATTSMAVGNLLAGLAFPVVLGSFVAPHASLWGWPSLDLLTSYPVLIGVLVASGAGIFVHEWLHKLGFVLGGAAWSDVKFGFDMKSLTPFTRCLVPMPSRAYRVALAIPGIVLGFAPALAGVAFGSWPLLLYGGFFTAAAGGDALALWAIRRVGATEMVLDHPSRIGCLVLKRNPASQN